MSLIDKVRQAKARTEEKLSRGGGSGAQFWRPANGENRIRIMPSWTDEGEEFWREVSQHWNLAEDQKGPVLCPKNTPDMDGACPVCELVEELRQDKSNLEAQALVKDIRAKTTYLLNIVDMKDPVYTANDVAEHKKNNPDRECPFEPGEAKVQIYACPTTIFDNILGIISSSGKDITHLGTGRNLIITKFPNKDRFKTRYTCQPELDPTEAQVAPGTKFPELDKVGYAMEYEALLELLNKGVGASLALPADNTPSVRALVATGINKPASDADLEEVLRRELSSK